MTRAIRRLLTCVFLGLLTAIALAWVAASPVHVDFGRIVQCPRAGGVEYVLRVQTGIGFERVGLEYLAWPRDEWVAYDVFLGDMDRVRHEAIEWLSKRRAFPAWAQIPAADSLYTSGLGADVQQACGWPLPALRCEWKGSRAPRPQPPSVSGGIPLAAVNTADPRDGLRALPYRPIPLGLAADSLLFALVWSGILVAPRAIRRAIRRRHGQCLECGYDLSGVSGKCPECGHGC